MALARSRVPDDRRRLLMGIADLCEGSAEEIRAAQGIVSDVFLTLVRQAEHDIRMALAERLADAAWAPASLVNILALDEIEIARPIIAKSPILKLTPPSFTLTLAAPGARVPRQNGGTRHGRRIGCGRIAEGQGRRR